MKRLSKLYSQCNDNGDFCDEEGKLSTEVEKEVYRLLDKFGLAHDQYNKVYADVSARSEVGGFGNDVGTPYLSLSPAAQAGSPAGAVGRSASSLLLE